MATADGTLDGAPGAKYEDLIKASREYEPLIPTAVVDYHLRKAGCVMSNPDLVRIVALAAQKITCEIVTESRARAYGRQKAEKRKPSMHGDDDAAKKPKLVTKDLEGSLTKIGVITDVPPFYTEPSTSTQ